MDMTRTTRRPAAEPSLGLLVRNPTTTFDVAASQRGRRVPGGVRLRKPLLGRPDGAALPVGSAELVGRLLDSDGQIVEEYGWSQSSRDFYDFRTPGGDLRGYSRRAPDDPRSFCLPVPTGVEYLSMSLAELIPGAGGPVVRETPLRLLRLTTSSTRRAARLVPPADPRTGQRVVLTELDFRTTAGAVSRRPTPPPHGYIDGTVSLHASNRPFDIVITGDGFAVGDKAAFLAEADVLISGLRNMQPFKRLDAKINYHKVIAVSDDSGVSDPIGDQVVRNTYYHSTTGFNGSPNRGNVGTPYPEIVKQAASLVRPWCEIDVVIVIANIAEYGGYAMRRNGTAFVCRSQNDTDLEFTHLAAHESGHVVARLADEYISCDKYDPTDPRPNTGTAEELQAGTISWRTLAHDLGELKANGEFKLVHRYGDPWNAALGEPNLPVADLTRIGAFWGCMFSDPSVNAMTEYCDVFGDARSAGFYRPAARCVMRRIRYEFCAVCECAYAEAIQPTLMIPRIPRTLPNEVLHPADIRRRRPSIQPRPVR